MKVSVVGYRKNYFENEIKKETKLILTEDNPDVVIAFGGEGTFLYSEMIYSGIPKVFVRHPSKCKKCKSHNYKKVIKSLVEKRFKIIETIKVQASVRGRKLVGLNEVNIHYKPPCAIRFNISIDKKFLVKECIGDGLVVATPYGSSAYFFSIARKTFKKGLGLAFNNPVKPVRHKVVPEGSVIKVKVLRGPGVLCADCNKEVIPLKINDVIRIQKHNNFARILKLKNEKKVRI